MRGFSRTFLRLYRLAMRARGKAFSLIISRSFAFFGVNSVIQPPLRLTGESKIGIGSHVFIGAGSWLQVLNENSDEPVIVIGDGTSIAGNCTISAGSSIKLGSKVLVARNVYISDHIHAYADLEVPVMDQGIARVEPVEICDGAWLGENVVVCPGVRIGRGAVVGANAVVLEDVPDHALAVGVPARVVRVFGEAQPSSA